MKRKKQKRRYTRLIDLVCNIILLIVMVFTLYKAFGLDMIPGNWMMILIAAMIVIFLIFFVLMFIQLPSWGIGIKRFFLVVLCAAIGFAGYSMGNVTSAVNHVSIAEQSSTIKLYLLTQKESDITSTEDFAGRTLGIQSGTDKVNSEYVKEKIDASLHESPAYQEAIDYSSLTNLFINHMIDGMAISQDYLEMMEKNIEGFKDSYTIISTYEKDRPVNLSDNKDITKESFTLLISGVDEMGAADMTQLSDVNILLFVNPIANTISMVSLSRDSFMPRAAYQWQNDKLTHTGWTGVEDTRDTIENFFGIDIDYYAKVSFTSLIEIVDAIDGVDVDVEIAFTEQDENRSFAAEDLITLEKGMQHLNGKQALAYARHRKTANYDVAGRQRAQEKIIKAIIDRLLSPQGITIYVNKLMDIVPNYVVTDMPGKQITSFIKGELSNLKPWSIQSIAIEHGLDDRRTGAASAPNDEIDCYLWNRYDYRHVLDAYEASKKNMNFSEFNFDLGDYAKYMPDIEENPQIVWDFQAINPY